MTSSGSKELHAEIFKTAGGVDVFRTAEVMTTPDPLEVILDRIDHHPGGVFASGYEYPGRYSRWDIGFIDPPVELVSSGRTFSIRALNTRGTQVIQILRLGLEDQQHLVNLESTPGVIMGTIAPMPAGFPEEQRSKQPTIFSVLRAISAQWANRRDPHIGLYGAFGYDLVFQFEPIDLRHDRTNSKDLHLFLPDELIVVDHRKETATRCLYDFSYQGHSTVDLPRESVSRQYKTGKQGSIRSDHAPGEYADKVRQVIAGTRRGDFYEVVLSQVLSADYGGTPRALFETIRQTNPSPYEFMLNLGVEQLIGASPEMFVRVENGMVETCPISGTVPRGGTPIEDADQIRALLNSPKEEAELTMCTDVDRNDKARVCKAGTVRVIGRRLIEIYSRLIHTVDHVVGELRDDCDAYDALLSHLWACTLTGAPKPAAMQMVENLENSPRRWYGGCIGMILFNGGINTGITIRTVHLQDGVATVRVGATLLSESDPDAEERETRTKAEAFVTAVVGRTRDTPAPSPVQTRPGTGKRVLFVDNRDSFVHTLGDYVRQTGADTITVRSEFVPEMLDQVAPDLVFISPGPGTPGDFGIPDLVRTCVDRQVAVFGVCLGHQGIVEAFGGRLGTLDTPMHGKTSNIHCSRRHFFTGFPPVFTAGRYHSLYAVKSDLPACLEVLAESDDGVIMAVAHRELPMAGVQFHPESILSMKDDLGLRLIVQVIDQLAGRRAHAA